LKRHLYLTDLFVTNYFRNEILCLNLIFPLVTGVGHSEAPLVTHSEVPLVTLGHCQQIVAQFCKQLTCLDKSEGYFLDRSVVTEK